MAENILFAIGADAEEKMRKLELMAMAKAWSTKQKMAYLGLALPNLVEPLIDKSLTMSASHPNWCKVSNIDDKMIMKDGCLY